ncbi:methyltransferase domain-containing protein [Novosphingobium sp. KN65.2]|uniref:methyltransferase domain-containing protein n=1 Tax=Novosphingobium sp. KN65.2 TaxID=1478134 RepID=UPI0005DEF397|nr:methyltransferase domain-containing protein [Novosphingobium sp. KN65.2]CDO36568.1 Methyltransferase type 12 [Novosphingobium sp. KN65.2]
MASLAVRSRQDEQMDALDLDAGTYAQVLRDLARVNRWTFTAHPALAYLRKATRGVTAFSLLDVGFGHGDLLRAVARWAQRQGIAARLVGVDINPRSEPIARSATPDDLGIDFRTGDYADQPETFDHIVSSQVTHHMSDAQLTAFLHHMDSRARRGWLISDLHRHRFAYHGFPWLARAMGVHRIVREDGQLSIARSFRKEDWVEILTEAGIDAERVQIVRRFAFRLSVEYIKSGGPNAI